MLARMLSQQMVSTSSSSTSSWKSTRLLLLLCSWTLLLPTTTAQASTSGSSVRPYRFTLHTNRISSGPAPYQWFSVSTFQSPTTQEAFVLYAGAVLSPQSQTPWTNNRYLNHSTLFLCPFVLHASNQELTMKHPSCQEVLSQTPGFLGASMKALPNSRERLSLVVVCDPHASTPSASGSSSSSETVFPAGKCFVYKHDWDGNANLTPFKTLSFCSEAGNGQEATSRPCMGGYAIDLVSVNEQMKLYVGWPFEDSGSVVSFDNLLANISPESKEKEGVATGVQFGFGVAGVRDSAFVSAPLSQGKGPYVTKINSAKTTFRPSQTDEFSSFGTVLETIALKETTGVLIAAPFTSLRDGSNNETLVNAGRVYLGCANHTLTHVSGRSADEYFGMSVSTVGDIDGDGNEDFAVGAPMLRSQGIGGGESVGLVYIFLTRSPCGIDPEPYQILNISQEEGAAQVRHFGYLLNGKTDLDFDGINDLVVAGLHSEQIVIYRSKNHIKAECHLSDTIPKSPLRKGDHISLLITVTFKNSKTNAKVSNADILAEGRRKLQFQPDLSLSAEESSAAKMARFDVLQEIWTPVESANSADNFRVRIVMSSQMAAETMNLRQKPVNVSLYDIWQSDDDTANVIDWSQCRKTLSLRSFQCQGQGQSTDQEQDPNNCQCDVGVRAQDSSGHYDVHYLASQSEIRKVNVTVFYDRQKASPVHTELHIVSSGAFYLVNVLDTKKTQRFQLKKLHKQHFAVIIDYGENANNFYLNSDVTLTVEVAFNSDQVSLFANSSISYNVSTLNDDANPTNNVLHTAYRVVLQPQLGIYPNKSAGDVFDNRTELADLIVNQRYFLDDIGPPLVHSYSIQNQGQSRLRNVTLGLWLPLYFHDSASPVNYLFYFFSKVRVLGAAEGSSEEEVLPITVVSPDSGKVRGSCVLPAEAENPLNIIALRKDSGSSASFTERRSRRSAEAAAASEPELFQAGFLSGQKTPVNAESVQCGSQSDSGGQAPKPYCVRIVCQVPELASQERVQLMVNGRLWARSMFRLKIPFIEIHSQLTARVESVPAGVHFLPTSEASNTTSKRFYFNKIQPKERQTPIWPIILGIVLGILLLLIIVVLLYRCGFFTRKRRDELMAAAEAKKRQQQEKARQSGSGGGVQIQHKEKEAAPMYTPVPNSEEDTSGEL